MIRKKQHKMFQRTWDRKRTAVIAGGPLCETIDDSKTPSEHAFGRDMLHRAERQAMTHGKIPPVYLPA